MFRTIWFRKGLSNLSLKVPTLPEQVEIIRILDIIIVKENKAKQAAEAVLEQIDLLKKSILARAFRWSCKKMEKYY